MFLIWRLTMNKKLQRQALLQDFLSFALSCFALWVFFYRPAFAAPANADAAMVAVKDGICGLLDALNILSVATVTIAIMWCGYKWLYKHAELSEIARIFIGALFIAGAGQITAMLIPGQQGCKGQAAAAP
jgi:TrbC/VIRB2 pilin